MLIETHYITSNVTATNSSGQLVKGYIEVN